MSNSVAREVEHRAQNALTRSPIQALRSLRVRHDGNQVVISGRLSTFYHKQLAQELVRAVVEDLQVVNSIDVD